MDVRIAVAGPKRSASLNELNQRERRSLWLAAGDRPDSPASLKFIGQLAVVFLAYFIAGKLGQATTSIRSSNLGPVWPAYGIALGALIAFGSRVWPAILLSAFVIAAEGSVAPFGAAGQASAATLAALTGAFLLRRRPNFDPSLPRLRDALAFVAVGAFGSALISSSLGIASLYAAGIQPYSGLPSAWLIYWLGDSTGVLLVTPLLFALPALAHRVRTRAAEFAVLVTLLTGACFVVFGDVPQPLSRPHILAFAVLPFVIWSSIDFGIGGTTLSVFVIAAVATTFTAFGTGPFAGSRPFDNATLLDLFFVVLSVSGLAVAAVVAERERAERDRERLLKEQTAMEARLPLAAIVESSDDAIFSEALDGTILTWNAAAERMFGFTASEAIGQSSSMLIPPENREEAAMMLQELTSGTPIVNRETTRLTKSGDRISVSTTLSPIHAADGALTGAARIIRDISNQKRAEEALSNISRKLIEAQEQERIRIARELHDDVGQRLALLTNKLAAIADASAESAQQRSEIVELQDQLSAVSTDIQTLSHTLHSSKIDILGVTAGTRLFCREFAEHQNVQVHLQTDGVPPRLPPNISLCLFRVLQEALHNAAKHSGAKEFTVRLVGSADEIQLIVSDSGCGFDVRAAQTRGGIGLVSMTERVRLVGGALSIESHPSRGTSVHARVPLTKPA